MQPCFFSLSIAGLMSYCVAVLCLVQPEECACLGISTLPVRRCLCAGRWDCRLEGCRFVYTHGLDISRSATCMDAEWAQLSFSSPPGNKEMGLVQQRALGKNNTLASLATTVGRTRSHMARLHGVCPKTRKIVLNQLISFMRGLGRDGAIEI